MARKQSKAERDRTVLKFLSVWPDPRDSKSIVRKSSDNVIKSIVNAVLNIERSQHLKGRLSPALRRRLTRHRQQIARLTTGRGSVGNKRKVILQHGGAFLSLLPLILSTVLGTLGPAILPKVLDK